MKTGEERKGNWIFLEKLGDPRTIVNSSPDFQHINMSMRLQLDDILLLPTNWNYSTTPRSIVTVSNYSINILTDILLIFHHASFQRTKRNFT